MGNFQPRILHFGQEKNLQQISNSPKFRGKIIASPLTFTHPFATMPLPPTAM